MTMEFLNLLIRWGHVLFGITWIGMLYYFNFVQGGYFKQASPEGLADAKEKLAPSALWWFRWGAMFTFITGVILLGMVHGYGQLNNYIIVGAAMGTLMAANVWMVIWPAQKIALGIVRLVPAVPLTTRHPPRPACSLAMLLLSTFVAGCGIGGIFALCGSADIFDFVSPIRSLCP